MNEEQTRWLLQHGKRLVALEDENRKLKADIESLQEDFSVAIQMDLEQGVAWLNAESSKDFAQRFPLILAAINKLLGMERVK